MENIFYEIYRCDLYHLSYVPALTWLRHKVLPCTVNPFRPSVIPSLFTFRSLSQQQLITFYWGLRYGCVIEICSYVLHKAYYSIYAILLLKLTINVITWHFCSFFQILNTCIVIYNCQSWIWNVAFIPGQSSDSPSVWVWKPMLAISVS